MKKLPKIFIVEDDPFYANLLEQEIKKSRIGKVETFHSGENFLDNLFKMPDIVLLDHNLGTMSGIDILKQIKSVNPNIQVIFLSAQEKMNVAIQSLKYGAYDYVEKSESAIRRVKDLIKKIIKYKKIVKEKRDFKKVKIVLAILLTTIVGVALYLQFEHSSIFF